jgi:hypothetical protein
MKHRSRIAATAPGGDNARALGLRGHAKYRAEKLHYELSR